MRNNINIHEALARFNSNARKKMTMGELAEKVLPNIDNPLRHISGWANGTNSLTKLQPMHIIKICKELKCDANFLFGMK